MRMFGGLALLISGNMAVAASGSGGLMVRVDPERTEGRAARSAGRRGGHARKLTTPARG